LNVKATVYPKIKIHICKAYVKQNVFKLGLRFMKGVVTGISTTAARTNTG